MRYVVYGAGAIGGVVGARLAQAGRQVVVIARGAHADAIEARGLTVEDPDTTETIPVAVARHPGELIFGPDDRVLLAVKSQDTVEALTAQRAAAPPSTAVACLQNGVENERQALRWFANVYGVVVMCPTGHLEPGVVQAYSAPVTGLLDVGRYPGGTDAVVDELVDGFAGAGFDSMARPDVMRWKYAKLLLNLGNALEAASGPEARTSPAAEVVKAEGVACLRAAGIDFASDDEDRTRRGGLLTVRPLGGDKRGGGSTWQSLHRRTGAVETDYLNGEIVLLGRRYGVPTPANALLQQLIAELAAAGIGPGSITADQLTERLAAGSPG